jgi:hypothetical protein
MIFKLLKSGWRPVFAWLFILFYFGTGLTVLAQVWIDESRVEDVAGLIVSMIGFGGAVLGVYTAGRSWEKRHGEEISEYETLPTREAAPDYYGIQTGRGGGHGSGKPPSK